MLIPNPLLALALLAAGGSLPSTVEARPTSSHGQQQQQQVDKRIVPTVICAVFPLPEGSSLFENVSTVVSQLAISPRDGLLARVPAPFLEPGTEDDDDLVVPVDPPAATGTFGFEVCQSTFRNNTSNNTTIYGHATYANATGTFCLTSEYPYLNSTVSPEECSFTDDSSQFLQWWRLTLNATGGTDNVLEFLAPLGRPLLITALGPSNTTTDATVQLTQSKDSLSSFFFFGGSSSSNDSVPVEPVLNTTSTIVV